MDLGSRLGDCMEALESMPESVRHPIPNHIYTGDCREILPLFEPESVDLIITSPPYADQRKHSYGGIPPDEYVAWFLPIADQLYRVLKPTGSFVLNIKERVVDGERHAYVIELILEMRKRGWRWTEEYCWHKKNCYAELIDRFCNKDFSIDWHKLVMFNSGNLSDLGQPL